MIPAPEIASPATTNNVYTTYSSNNKKIATVSSSGVVTGTGVGTTTIFVKVPACGELNTPVKVTVTKSDLNPSVSKYLDLSSTFNGICAHIKSAIMDRNKVAKIEVDIILIIINIL